jgi:hypothetical protein
MRYQRLALVGAVAAASFVVTIQLRSSTCRRMDLATILAKSQYCSRPRQRPSLLRQG